MTMLYVVYTSIYIVTRPWTVQQDSKVRVNTHAAALTEQGKRQVKEVLFLRELCVIVVALLWKRREDGADGENKPHLATSLHDSTCALDRQGEGTTPYDERSAILVRAAQWCEIDTSDLVYWVRLCNWFRSTGSRPTRQSPGTCASWCASPRGMTSARR